MKSIGKFTVAVDMNDDDDELEMAEVIYEALKGKVEIIAVEFIDFI